MKKMTKGTRYKVTATLAFLFITVGCQPPAPSAPATYTVSGSINVANNTFTDSDINDVYATDYMVANDDYSSAQPISDPAVVGGYVNTAYAGDSQHPGNTYYTGDLADYYSVSLKNGEKVNLYIADASQYLDLYLYNSDGTTESVTPNTSTTQSKSLTVPADGAYFVAVKPQSGFNASNYTLTVGQPTITSASVPLPSDDFAPGEVLVRFKESALPLGIQSSGTVANMVGMKYISGAPGRVMLLGLGDSTQQKQAAKALGFQPTPSSQAANTTEQLKLDTKKAVQALRRRSDVLSADLNYRRHAFITPSDNNYTSQWDLPMMELPQAWEDPTRGNGAIVAVIDTGVLLSHPDLAGQFSADGGYDFISDPSVAGDGDGIDTNPDDNGDKVPPETRSSFHGTHVSGTIAALTSFTGDVASNGNVGVASIAPHAKIMPLRVLGKGGGYDSDIIQAMYYAANLSNNSGMTPSSRGGQRADIINMSLGGGGSSSTFQSAVDQVRAAGVIIIAAAGNESTSTPSYPAAYSGVVSVSAVGPTKTLAYYSNYGSTIDVTAPGGDQSVNYSDGILSTLGDDSGASTTFTYGFYQGTSMASPHVAGVAALMVPVYLANNGMAMTPSDFDTYLSQGVLTDDISGDGATVRNNNYGYGLINANKSLTAAGLVLDIPPTMIPDNTAVDLGGISTSVTISVKNIAQGTYAGQTVDNVTATPDTSSSAWLSVGALSSTTITTTTPVTFTISVNRTGVLDGYYSGTVTLHSTTAGVADVVIAVSMYKGSIAGDAGYQYITLVDTATQSQVVQVPTSRDPVTGSYSFSFANVPDGNYFIVSGSDMDNDFFICDEGEACGAYPDVGAFSVSGANVSGILFSSGYYVPSGTASLSTNTASRQIRQFKTASDKQVQAR